MRNVILLGVSTYIYFDDLNAYKLAFFLDIFVFILAFPSCIFETFWFEGTMS